MIYSAFSGWVAQYAAAGFQHDSDEDCEEMIGYFWVWVCSKCKFEDFDPAKGSFAAWFRAVCRNRLNDFDRKRRSVPEIPVLMGG